MIVEQRIGRIQRLASEHASVLHLQSDSGGTFEEYIVGRLMEKLQLASHAIGDIEALLEATGVDDDDEGAGFVEKIRKLVIDALAGVDVEEATKKAEESIDAAANALEKEQKNIDAMLGAMDGKAYAGPPAPKLPHRAPSMSARDFTLSALQHLGATVTPRSDDSYLNEHEGTPELIRFETGTSGYAPQAVLYAPGTPPFLRLVSQILAEGRHRVDDLDSATKLEASATAARWVLAFGGSPKIARIVETRCCFDGTALARVRTAVAHDSYEQLLEIPCSSEEHSVASG